MKLKKIKYLLISFFSYGMLSFTQFLCAQPFSQFELGVIISSPSVSEAKYSEKWALSEKISFSIRTPYYLIDLGFKTDYYTYKPIDTKSEEYSALNFSMGFSKKIRLTGMLHTRIELGTGAVFYPELKELEIFYSAQVEPSFDFKKISIVTVIGLRRIQNYHVQSLIYYGLGIQYRINISSKFRSLIN